MGRYLEGWEDAQSRGSSRNGGRGGETAGYGLCVILTTSLVNLPVSDGIAKSRFRHPLLVS